MESCYCWWGAGGMSTASNIRRLDKDAEITVITRMKMWHILHVCYSLCIVQDFFF